MSSFTKDLIIKKIAKRKWEVCEAFEYHVGAEDSNVVVKVPVGFITDGASIPRIFWVLIGHPLAEYAQAAVLHDCLYTIKKFTRKRSDYIFLEAMGVLNVAWWKRRIMYRVVRLCGGILWNKKNEGKEGEKP